MYNAGIDSQSPDSSIYLWTVVSIFAFLFDHNKATYLPIWCKYYACSSLYNSTYMDRCNHNLCEKVEEMKNELSYILGKWSSLA